MSTIKIILREAFDVIEELVPKAARAVAQKSGRLGTKTREIRRSIDSTDRDLAGSQRTPDRAPDHDAPERVTVNADGIEVPREGMPVWRVYGEAQDAIGGLQRGSLPGGASWTPVDPRGSADFRWDAGLPDENPGRFLIEGILRDPGSVTDVRPALPLDGNPGGWPEYLIDSPLDAIEITDVSGVNAPWTHGPGDWAPPVQ